MEEKKSINISVKSFIVSTSIILALMIFAYVLTFLLPAGEFVRVTDANGNSVIDTSIDAKGTYVETDASFPFWKFLLSPILVLGTDGNVTLILIVIFLLVIGGIFQALTDKNLIEYLLKYVVDKFYDKRKVLLVLLPLLFMALSSTAGVSEEAIPLVPIICALTVSLGWDTLTGLGVSIIPCACGYAAGLVNPFGTGVAQKVAGIPVFSGIWMRFVTFFVLYGILVAFLLLYTAKYEKSHPNMQITGRAAFVRNIPEERGIKTFGIVILTGVLIIISSVFIPAIQDYTLAIFALCFLIGGILGCSFAGMKAKEFCHSFLSGMKSMAPALIMILLASSIKYILTESKTIDTLIKYMMVATDNLPPYVLLLFIYLVVLILEFFVPSGSAKAFLLVPLLMPIGTVYNLAPNLIVLAYIFGDGLANVLYPTNPGLLIAINLAGSSYPKYMKYCWKLMCTLFLATCLLLLLALTVGYR